MAHPERRFFEGVTACTTFRQSLRDIGVSGTLGVAGHMAEPPRPKGVDEFATVDTAKAIRRGLFELGGVGLTAGPFSSSSPWTSGLGEAPPASSIPSKS